MEVPIYKKKYLKEMNEKFFWNVLWTTKNYLLKFSRSNFLYSTVIICSVYGTVLYIYKEPNVQKYYVHF